jgi:hypothetical protein
MEGGDEVVVGGGVEVVLEGGGGMPRGNVVAGPLDQETATSAGPAVVEEGFDMEMLLTVDDVGRRGVADGGGVEGAGEGLEGGDVDDGVVM